MTKTCKSCQGTGWIDTGNCSPPEQCEDCGGKGIVIVKETED